MRVVGITGGIGSGKSTICRILEEMGFPIYNADERAKCLINSSSALIASVKMEFGDEIYTDQGLNRQVLAEVVFKDASRLERLNSLVHPAVSVDFKDWTRQQKSPVVFKEAAILFESGADKGVDETILVTAPEEIRLSRVINRDQVNPEAVKARMANQWTEHRKRELAGHVMNNDGQTLIIPQINALLDLWVK